MICIYCDIYCIWRFEFKKICSRYSAAWQWRLSITQSFVMACHLAISIPSCKVLYKSFILSGAVYSSLQLGISVNKALGIYIANPLRSHHRTKHAPPSLSCSWSDLEANKSCCSSLWLLCFVLSLPVYSLFPSQQKRQVQGTIALLWYILWYILYLKIWT